MTTPPLCDPPLPHATAPRNRIPSGACDCHFHVFAPPSNQVLGRRYTAPPAPIEAYRSLQKTLGLDRGVIVQPSVYGSDNRTTLEHVASDGSMKAIVVVEAGTPVSDLQAFARQGAVGARANLLFPSDVDLANLEALTRRMANFGWHLQVLADVSTLLDLLEFVARLPVPVVFDHMGHVPADRAVKDPGFQALLSLLGQGDVWVKLSGAYRIAPEDASQASDMAKALIAANPDQVIWGTDWPHPAIEAEMPDDGSLLDLLFDWAKPAVVEKILVQNPEALYGFAPWEGAHAE